MKPYILLNSALRQKASNEFEKNFYKLMNNSVYGKTCENLKKRQDTRLVLDDKTAKKLIEKPHCLGFRIFTENLVGVSPRKTQAMINKPFQVGFSVLNLSKLHMYKVHYEFIQKKYGGRAELLVTDTDSLVY